MANRLINEKSPYLLQHAHNPIDWYPWGEDAFVKARSEDKPIFLSVGYSTCHWCHVMEHESFEQDAIAALLNSGFVSIKVDREERPDVDRIYMTALQAMGQNGGWPMTMFLTPDLKPFYGGTYFPPEQRYGRAGLPDILRKIDEVWRTERHNVEESANTIATYLHDLSSAAAGNALPDPAIIDQCFEQLAATFDPAHGGFGTGAKFPRPVTLEFLLRYHRRSGRPEALHLVSTTLDAMASGGLHDHIGGGFHRYTVDAEWRVPHFEKMLYDQAQLVNVYLNAYLVSGNHRYTEIVRDTLTYVLRDLPGRDGGFCSAEDADSPKPDDPSEVGEGAFYLWSKEEIRRLLGEEAGERFSLSYGVEVGGNALVDPQHEFSGKNILYMPEEFPALANMVHLSESDLQAELARGREILRSARAKRPRPLKDDKILTAWNGLMIGALARSGWVLGDPAYLESARRAGRFVLTSLRDGSSGRLFRRYREGEARFEGHLEDYAFVVHGLLDLFEATGEGEWLDASIALSRTMIDLFIDADRGGFFDSSGEDHSVLARLKEYYDGAEPGGNSVATMNLLRLFSLTGDDSWRVPAERTLAAFGPVMESRPVALPHMLSALDRLLTPAREIVLVGPEGDRRTDALVQEVRSRYLPDAVVIRAQDESGAAVQKTFAANLPLVIGKPAAYVCENYTCRLPATDAKDLAAILDGKNRV